MGGTRACSKFVVVQAVVLLTPGMNERINLPPNQRENQAVSGPLSLRVRMEGRGAGGVEEGSRRRRAEGGGGALPYLRVAMTER